MTLQVSAETGDSFQNSYAIRFPDHHNDRSQNEECCEVLLRGHWQRFRLHDYDAIYQIPGLYEQLFAERLQCNSPQRVIALFSDVLNDWAVHPAGLRVLDFGAGNGMVGEELRSLGVGALVGVDILPEAAEAAGRDRPLVYDDYIVADFSDSNNPHVHRVISSQLNCLITVAALGFGDVPPNAFITAFNSISTPGWVVFNIKESFLGGIDDTGFAHLVRLMCDQEIIQIQAYRRYSHRMSVSGQRLHYVAIVARKLQPTSLTVLEAAE